MYNIFILACTNGVDCIFVSQRVERFLSIVRYTNNRLQDLLASAHRTARMVEEEVAKRKRKSRNQRDGKKRRKEETFDETEYDIIGDDLMLRAVRPMSIGTRLLQKGDGLKKSHWDVFC